MNRLLVLATAVLVVLAAPQPGLAQSQDDALRAEFEAVIAGLNDSFRFRARDIIRHTPEKTALLREN